MANSNCGYVSPGETTQAGVQHHRRNGTDPCDVCRKANAAYQRAYRSSGAKGAVNGKLYGKAQTLALVQLKNEYPDRYEDILGQLLADLGYFQARKTSDRAERGSIVQGRG